MFITVLVLEKFKTEKRIKDNKKTIPINNIYFKKCIYILFYTYLFYRYNN